MPAPQSNPHPHRPNHTPPHRHLTAHSPPGRFIALADAIEEAFPDLLVEGNPGGDEEGRPGAFEVTSEDGTPLFSRLSSGQYPDPAGLVRAIAGSYKGRSLADIDDACG